MPLRYKVGDKVRVGSEWCDGDESSQGCAFIDDMEIYSNRIVTIDKIRDGFYRIVEDDGMWCWDEEFFEPVNGVFVEDNVVLLRNGQMRIVHRDALYLPNGTCIEIENYTGRKHNFDENFDIVEVHRKATGNYKFDLSGELVQEEN